MEDEFWFFSLNEHQKPRFVTDSDPLKLARRRIDTSMVMGTLFWNTPELYACNFLTGGLLDAD
jgi:hypothetical protein